jgi:hypothetical protein
MPDQEVMFCEPLGKALNPVVKEPEKTLYQSLQWGIAGS